MFQFQVFFEKFSYKFYDWKKVFCFASLRPVSVPPALGNEANMESTTARSQNLGGGVSEASERFNGTQFYQFFWEGRFKTMQSCGDFEGFPPQCIVWVGVISWVPDSFLEVLSLL